MKEGMTIADILSDLTSLRVCDHPAALALVTAHKSLSPALDLPPQQESNQTTIGRSEDSQGKGEERDKEETDPDLQRALDLVELHVGVKEKYAAEGGRSVELDECRREVERVLGVGMGT